MKKQFKNWFKSNLAFNTLGVLMLLMALSFLIAIITQIIIAI